MISDRLNAVKSSISDVCRKTGRNPEDVILVGVTKYTTVENVQAALAAGLKDIGENYVQDAKDKFEAVGPAVNGARKHLLGHLQSNKAKLAVQLFDVIQSVDSIKLIDELEKGAHKFEKTIDILLEVKTSYEDTKTGAGAGDVRAMIDHVIAKTQRIRVKGLMTMAPNTEDQSLIRKSFRDLKNLFEQLKTEYAGQDKVEMKHLSMGMSADYLLAVEEGSTMVRVGSAIFK